MTPTSTPPVSREQIEAAQAEFDRWCSGFNSALPEEERHQVLRQDGKEFHIISSHGRKSDRDRALRDLSWEAAIRAALDHTLPAADAGRAASPSPVKEGETGTPITLRYTNWRGETADRTILPTGRVIYGTNEWHKEPCYMLEAVDIEKGEVRTFALAGFGGIDPDAREAASLLSPHQSTAPDGGSDA